MRLFKYENAPFNITKYLSKINQMKIYFSCEVDEKRNGTFGLSDK